MTSSAASCMASVPVIDLFAGPGGLGEGFGAFQAGGKPPFEVRLSIEKDAIACATLRLRNFFRQFEQTPEELLAYFAGEAPLADAFAAYPEEAASAGAAVWHAELGRISARTVVRRVRDCIGECSDWVLLGGPPCQAYSIAGRSRMRTTHPDFERDERHLLYQEYLRIVADHAPAVFVLENVKGLLTSKHGGRRIVTRILDDLSAPGKALGTGLRSARRYRLYALGQRQGTLPWMNEEQQDGEEFLVRAEEFGIPQMRHRIFIVGVRSDIPGRPATLQLQEEITAGEVLSDLPPIRSQLSRAEDSFASWRRAVSEIRNWSWMSASDGRGLAPVAREIRRTIGMLSETQLDVGAAYLRHRASPKALGAWYRHKTMGLTHHDSRAHMQSDLHRYIFASTFARVHSRSPELKDFPKELRPAHRNVTAAIEGGEMFNDRFRVQLEHRPSTTITSHISKDGHYYIHPDPLQCRSLTVREAARLQTFPDNYFFEGNKTHKYHQIGNAVPPLLAMGIARVVHDLLVAADRLGPPSVSVTRKRRIAFRAAHAR
jgi:DNA (cytosine-5)-methyltransferase 1